MSDNDSDNQGLPIFSGAQMGLLIGAALSMVLLLIICRYCINILVIDIFILGNYESLRCLCPCFRCCQQDDDGDLEHGLNARGMLHLQSIGALGNQVAFIYQLPEEKRKKFIMDVIYPEVRYMFERRTLCFFLKKSFFSFSVSVI